MAAPSLCLGGALASLSRQCPVIVLAILAHQWGLPSSVAVSRCGEAQAPTESAAREGLNSLVEPHVQFHPTESYGVRVMPREISNRPPLRSDTPEILREMATRARLYAWSMRDELTVARLNAFAEELEARAATLEIAPQVVSHDEAAATERDPDLGQS